MKGKRSKYKPEFKAEVAMEALKGDLTTAELAQRYKIHPAMVTQWKKQLVDNARTAFEKGLQRDEDPVDVDALYKKIGQLEVERDFLASRPGLMDLIKKGKR